MIAIFLTLLVATPSPTLNNPTPLTPDRLAWLIAATNLSAAPSLISAKQGHQLVRIGMTPEEVERVLGKPDGVIGFGPFGSDTVNIYRQRPFSIAFQDGYVSKIQYKADAETPRPK